MITYVKRFLMRLLFANGLIFVSISTSLYSAVEDKATLVVWTNDDLSGESHEISVTPNDMNQASRTVSRTELQDKGLENRLSSARLVCGARKAMVSFSDYSTKFGHRLVLDCDPHQSKTINFQDLKTHEGVFLSDKVAWYNLVVHAANHVSLDASVLGSLMWAVAVGEFLPEKVSTIKGAKVYWVNSEEVRLEQNIRVDDSYCDDQINKVIIPIKLTLQANPAGWGTKAVLKTSSYKVEFASETCKSYYYDKIYAGVGRGIGPLNEGLKIFASKFASTYYFTPSQYADKVFGNWGSEP